MNAFSFLRQLKIADFARRKRKCRGWAVAGRPALAERLEERCLLYGTDGFYSASVTTTPTSSASSPLTPGTSITVNVTLATDNGPPATGNVTILDNGTQAGTASLSYPMGNVYTSNASTTITLAAAPPGGNIDDISVNYPGDPNTAPATDVCDGYVYVTPTAAAIPTVTPPADQSAAAGVASSFNVGTLAESPAAGPFSVDVNWGDGQADSVFTMASPGTIPPQSHTFASAGTDTVGVTVTDSNGTASNTGTFAVTVSQQSLPTPTVTPPANQSAGAGVASSFNLGTLAESPAAGPYSVDVNWGDGQADSVFSMSSPGTIPPQSHTFASAGTDTVGVTVTDSNDTASNTGTFAVTVSQQSLPTPTPTPTAAPGSTDPTFNGGSSVVLGFAAQASGVTPAGQILLAGLESGASAGSTQAVLEQLNADGSVDSSFGAGGTVTDSATTAETFYALAAASDGTIIAAGASDGDLLLAAYNADGSVDTSFGAAGRVTVPIVGATDATAYGVTTDSSGNIVVVGSSGGQFFADRFTAAGAQDPGFNNGAPLLFGSAADGDVLGKVAVQNAANGGGIIAAGASAGSVVVVQLTPAGALDGGFGPGGIVTLAPLAAPDLSTGQPDYTEGLALDPAGDIVVANTTSGGEFATARLTSTGAMDNTFGSGGVVTTSFGGDDDADFVAIQPDGSQILVGGTDYANSTVQEAIAAYTPSGALDATFGTGGMELLGTGLSAAPALTRPSVRIAPLALGLGGNYLEQVFSNMGSGKLVVGAGQQGRATPAAGTVLRLIAPAPTSASLPTGTLGATVSAFLPVGTIVGGAKAKASAVVTVNNPTGQTVSGPVTVTLLVSLGQSLGGATQLLAVTEKLKLNAGAHKALRIKLSSFPSLPKGSYYLIATVKAPDGTVTGAAVATPSLTIAPAFITIKASNLLGLPAAIAPGEKLTLSLTLQNNGNVPAAGTAGLTVSLSASSTGTGGQTVATTPLRVKLKAGKSGVYRVRFVVPAGTAAGSYYLAASLAVSALGDTTTADGMAVSGVPISVG